MKTTVYLVRHGDVHNPQRVVYGRLPDFHLSELGKKQAAALGKFLSGKKIDAIYASPLTRTQETASFIAKHHNGISVVADERLLEVYSVKEGSPIADMELEQWNFYQPKYAKLGSERLSDIWHRMHSFFREKVRAHAGQTFVAVSHGDPIMISRIKHEGKPLRLMNIRGEYYVPTAKGLKLVFDEGRAIEVAELQF